MKKEERHAKMSEGVLQIGRLFEACTKVGLNESDIVIMLQTSTSLMCEMNDIDIAMYMKFLYVLHRCRLDASYDGSEEQVVHAELSALFAPSLDS